MMLTAPKSELPEKSPDSERLRLQIEIGSLNFGVSGKHHASDAEGSKQFKRPAVFPFRNARNHFTIPANRLNRIREFT